MADTSSSYVHDLVVGLAGAFASQSVGWFRGWLRDRDRVATDKVELTILVTTVARLEAAARKHEKDFNDFAESQRLHLKLLTTIVVERTGPMPQLPRETGEQAIANDE